MGSRSLHRPPKRLLHYVEPLRRALLTTSCEKKLAGGACTGPPKGGMMPRHVCHGSRPPRMKGMGAGAYPSCRSGSYHDGRGGKHSRELPLGPTERESPTLADWQRQPVLPWSFKTKVPLVTNKRYRGGVSTGRGPPFSVANGVACACGRAARSVEPRRHRPGPDPARSEPPLEPVMVPRHPPRCRSGSAGHPRLPGWPDRYLTVRLRWPRSVKERCSSGATGPCACPSGCPYQNPPFAGTLRAPGSVSVHCTARRKYLRGAARLGPW